MRGPRRDLDVPNAGPDDERTLPPRLPLPPRRASPTSSTPPVFNILLAGRARTGKTALLRLFLGTSSLAPTASPSYDRARAVAEAAQAALRPTTQVTWHSVELPRTLKRPRVSLNLIDTPGLDFRNQQLLDAGLDTIRAQIRDSYAVSPTASVSRCPIL